LDRVYVVSRIGVCVRVRPVAEIPRIVVVDEILVSTLAIGVDARLQGPEIVGNRRDARLGIVRAGDVRTAFGAVAVGLPEPPP
jgi:hypothetical protein